MANKLYEETNIRAIANAIRAKGQSGAMTVAQMPSKIGAISTKETVTWHQCPIAVKNYIDQVTYDPSDYSTSRIAEFAPATAVSSNTKPVGKTVDGVTYYNEVPLIETPFSSQNTAGTIKPLDSLRWINSVCIDDFRDLGGWNCDGGTVRYGKVFRGSRVVSMDADGISDLLDNLHLSAELDIRYDADIAQFPDTLKDYMEYLHVDGNWYSISNKSKWKAHLRFIFDCVAQNKPMFFHCAGGLDRTGTLACVIEGLLGVSQSDIDKDYELGCFYSGRGSEEQARRRNEDEWKGLITAIKSVSLPSGVADTFQNHVIYFVASLGFTEDEINAFRLAMIDGTPSTITLVLNSYSITKNGSNVSFSNPDTSTEQYQEYNLEIVADAGFAMTDISVTMGGVDITEQVIIGEFIPWGQISITENGDYDVTEYKKANVNISVPQVTKYSVSKTLGESTSNNANTEATENDSYAAVIVPRAGYNITSISVSMNGVDVTSQVVSLLDEV